MMSQIVDLCDFPVGELGEIADLEHSAVMFKEFGLSIGMPVIILQKAAQWLVQSKEYLQKIKVKPAGV